MCTSRMPSTSASGEVAATSRFDTIDLLRGFSILGVVLLHAGNWLSFSGYTIGASFPKWLRYVIFSEGGNGVSAFFAISGFLITFVSIRRFGSLQRLRAGAFYRIRFARIFPLLALLLFVLSVLDLAGFADFALKPATGSLGRALFATLTFQLNWFEAVHGFLPAPWTVLWSLSVEEMFYLFFPLLCIGLYGRRWFRPLFFVLLFGLVAFGPFARTPAYSRNDIWLYQSYLGNMDNVALGCLFALLTNAAAKNTRFVRSRWPLFCQALGTPLTLFIVVWEWPKVILGWRVKRAMGHSGTDVTVLGLGICLIMFGSVLRSAKGWRLTAPIRWLGRYSYEVYLTHEFVVMGILSSFLKTRKGPVGIWISVTVLLSAGLGFVLSRLLSEPMNRLLRGAPVPAELQPQTP